MSHPTKTTAAHLPVSETAHDLRAALSVTDQTLRRWELEGRIPTPSRIGRKKIWPAGTAAALLAGTAQTGGQQ